MSNPRLRYAGDAAIVVELGSSIDPAVNARAIALAERLRGEHVPGVHDVLATFRSVAVFFDPLRTDVEALRARLFTLPSDQERLPPPSLVEIPVEYGGDAGPDLDVVARGARLSADEVIARHAAREYRVFMIGFLPGFAYLGIVDDAIASARHATPRLRVAPGSVGIAGLQTGVYPQASPGGWQIIGRTTTRPFDAQRTPATLLTPGDRVRFVPVARGELGDIDAAWTARGGAFWLLPHARAVTVVRPGLMTTAQDGGRPGHQHEGVPVSGAMDPASMRDANRAVGNPATAAALEITLGGAELRLEHVGVLAVAGADLSATLDGRVVPSGTAVEHAARSVVRFESRRRGARAYLAFDGGLALPPCLGSVATDLTSGIGGVGGRRLQAGDCLPIGEARPLPVPGPSRPSRPLPAGGARVRVMPGPHGDWFPSEALDRLCRTRYEVTPESNRMGYRLRGAEPLPRDSREMISDATVGGGLQVPPSGQPILLTADRQVTGGYPIIATVITADLPVVGQLAPGDWIEFDACTRADALAALARLDASSGSRV